MQVLFLIVCTGAAYADASSPVSTPAPTPPSTPANPSTLITVAHKFVPGLDLKYALNASQTMNYGGAKASKFPMSMVLAGQLEETVKSVDSSGNATVVMSFTQGATYQNGFESNPPHDPNKPDATTTMIQSPRGKLVSAPSSSVDAKDFVEMMEQVSQVPWIDSVLPLDPIKQNASWVSVPKAGHVNETDRIATNLVSGHRIVTITRHDSSPSAPSDPQSRAKNGGVLLDKTVSDIICKFDLDGGYPISLSSTTTRTNTFDDSYRGHKASGKPNSNTTMIMSTKGSMTLISMHMLPN